MTLWWLLNHYYILNFFLLFSPLEVSLWDDSFDDWKTFKIIFYPMIQSKNKRYHNSNRTALEGFMNHYLFWGGSEQRMNCHVHIWPLMLSFSTLIQAMWITPPSSSLFSQNCQGLFHVRLSLLLHWMRRRPWSLQFLISFLSLRRNPQVLWVFMVFY